MGRIFSSSSVVRSFVFGVEDSLVSTVGLVSGIAVAGVSSGLILLTGAILVAVEAFSMAAGDLVTENTLREIRLKRITALSESMVPALVMFVSYALSGLLVLLPYSIFSPGQALYISAGVSLCALFCLGMIAGGLSHTSRFTNGIIMLSVGGLAIAIGIGASFLIQSLVGTLS